MAKSTSIGSALRRLRSFVCVTRGVAVAAALLILGAASISPPASAQAAAQAGIATVGQPAVLPGEYNGDLSTLPVAKPTFGVPGAYRQLLPGPRNDRLLPLREQAPAALPPVGPLAPMPPTSANFPGLSFADACTGGQCGAGWPPDTNGDVGRNHYILTVNDAVGIYSKTGTLLASFTENFLWAGVGTSPCNGNSFGDPVTLYDWQADRFVLTWFAFALNANGPISPFYQCIAAAKTSDPVAGGWWLYAIRMDPGTPGAPAVDNLNDYGKFGMWHDCMYMGANEFLFNNGNFVGYTGVAVGSFSRADMFTGAPLTYSLAFLAYPANDVFTLVPSNNNGKGILGVSPGTPNYLVSESTVAYSFQVRKFTAGQNCGAGGTIGAPTSVSQTSYALNFGAYVPQPNTAVKLDNIDDRIMQKVQYRKVGSAESLWVTHNAGATVTTMQWAQLDVTGGTVAAAPVQHGFHAPDATLFRWMGSIAADKDGNAALGYSMSNGTAPNFPSVMYAGRLASDPLNTLPQTEVALIAGGGSQANNCGGGPCDRWGDYSAMSIDPVDDCTFWYTNQYYDNQTSGNSGNWHTRVGSFKFPSCTALSGTSTIVSSSLNPSTFGQSVTIAATVTGTLPTGNVDFQDGFVSIPGCNAQPLLGGGNSPVATCTTSSLAVGTHNIVANYGGNAGNLGSNSGPLAQVVNPPPASVVLTSNSNPAPAGSNITLTATVTGLSSPPDGWVRFDEGSVSLPGCALVPLVGSGLVKTAQCVTMLSPGPHNLTATYIPSGRGSLPITSPPLAQGVNPPLPTTTAVVGTPNPSFNTGGTTFTATVTGSAPTGTVNFFDATYASVLAGCGAVPLTGSGSVRTAVCSAIGLAVGAHTINATYSGDAVNATSMGSTVQTVNACSGRTC